MLKQYKFDIERAFVLLVGGACTYATWYFFTSGAVIFEESFIGVRRGWSVHYGLLLGGCIMIGSTRALYEALGWMIKAIHEVQLRELRRDGRP